MAGLFGGAESSPLSGGSAPRRKAGHSAETTFGSPTKATTARPSAMGGSMLDRQAVSHSFAVRTGLNCGREDEGCFVSAMKQDHLSAGDNGVLAPEREDRSQKSSLEDLPDEMYVDRGGGVIFIA